MRMHQMCHYLHMLQVIQPLEYLGWKNPSEPPIPCAAPFIPIGHMTCHTCMVSDVIGDVTMS